MANLSNVNREYKREELFLLNEITQNLLFKEARRVFGRIVNYEVGYEALEDFEKDWNCLHQFVSYEKNPDRNFVEFIYHEKTGYDNCERWVSIKFDLLFNDDAVDEYILKKIEHEKLKRKQEKLMQEKKDRTLKENRRKLYERLKEEFEEN